MTHYYDEYDKKLSLYAQFLDDINDIVNSSGSPDQVKEWTNRIHAVVHQNAELSQRMRTAVTRALVKMSEVPSVDKQTYNVR